MFWLPKWNDHPTSKRCGKGCSITLVASNFSLFPSFLALSSLPSWNFFTLVYSLRRSDNLLRACLLIPPSSQLSQRYHNSRQHSRPEALSSVWGICWCHQHSSSPELECWKWKCASSQEVLVQGKAAPAQVVQTLLDTTRPAQVVQTLLDTTRPLRKVYLERADISIRDILDVSPVLRIPKWVRFNLCVC